VPGPSSWRHDRNHWPARCRELHHSAGRDRDQACRHDCQHTALEHRGCALGNMRGTMDRDCFELGTIRDTTTPSSGHAKGISTWRFVTPPRAGAGSPSGGCRKALHAAQIDLAP
jgi:hypothetical protein